MAEPPPCCPRVRWGHRDRRGRSWAGPAPPPTSIFSLFEGLGIASFLRLPGLHVSVTCSWTLAYARFRDLEMLFPVSPEIYFQSSSPLFYHRCVGGFSHCCPSEPTKRLMTCEEWETGGREPGNLDWPFGVHPTGHVNLCRAGSSFPAEESEGWGKAGGVA